MTELILTEFEGKYVIKLGIYLQIREDKYL